MGKELKIKATAKRARDGVWCLIIERCPYCGKRHQHGGGDGDVPQYGWRQAHCLNSTKSYELVPTEPTGYWLLSHSGKIMHIKEK